MNPDNVQNWLRTQPTKYLEVSSNGPDLRRVAASACLDLSAQFSQCTSKQSRFQLDVNMFVWPRGDAISPSLRVLVPQARLGPSDARLPAPCPRPPTSQALRRRSAGSGHQRLAGRVGWILFGYCRFRRCGVQAWEWRYWLLADWVRETVIGTRVLA